MWSYYGSKTNLVDLYPKPKYDTIIEPFAGAAKYSLKYFDRKVVLVDKYDVVIRIWKWLQKCSVDDIMKLPRNLGNGHKFDDVSWDCEEQRLFYSFVSGCGDSRPRNQMTKRKAIDRPNHVNYNLKKISDNLWKVRHWDIRLGDYRGLENIEATWYIDPPYEFGGQSYKFGSKGLDYVELREWCIGRQGQVIVCENTKATWMDFRPMVSQRGSLKSGTEAIWTNEPTLYDNEQLKIIL